MKKTILALLVMMGMTGNAFATGPITTNSTTPITCPSSSYGSPVEAQFMLPGGDSWMLRMYVVGTYTSGTVVGVYRQYYNTSNAQTTTCYDATPNGYSGYAGWIDVGGWNDYSNTPSFTTMDGSSFYTDDGGITWTKSTCAYSGIHGTRPYCPAPPTTSTSCYNHYVGGSYVPLTCSAGTYCQHVGHVGTTQTGACITACTHVSGYDACGCDNYLDPVAGVCPTGWVSVTFGSSTVCILPNTSTTPQCFAP